MLEGFACSSTFYFFDLLRSYMIRWKESGCAHITSKIVWRCLRHALFICNILCIHGKVLFYLIITSHNIDRVYGKKKERKNIRTDVHVTCTQTKNIEELSIMQDRITLDEQVSHRLNSILLSIFPFPSASFVCLGIRETSFCYNYPKWMGWQAVVGTVSINKC